jgi:hypothetical protein
MPTQVSWVSNDLDPRDFRVREREGEYTDRMASTY